MKKQKPLRPTQTCVTSRRCRACGHVPGGLASLRGRRIVLHGQEILTKNQAVSAMYAYLMNSWDELPEQNKRALGFDFVPGSEGEEEGLNHLARIFIEYADLSFRRAWVARCRRLGLDE